MVQICIPCITLPGWGVQEGMHACLCKGVRKLNTLTPNVQPNVQVENVKKGFPYIMFGDGHLASCKPISEADLASFMADCIEDKQKINQVLPIGGA